ncbi:hypothetical protein [Seohaeicola zhoushanensis]|uniref:hypothetical protein n=1 Tax=Seohaeicola zhoushanensis TaxID=1569283 RepID=UPI001677F0ED|nr:hypothetical protein [Seohaeicola zhoushanensis]
MLRWHVLALGEDFEGFGALGVFDVRTGSLQLPWSSVTAWGHPDFWKAGQPFLGCPARYQLRRGRL